MVCVSADLSDADLPHGESEEDNPSYIWRSLERSRIYCEDLDVLKGPANIAKISTSSIQRGPPTGSSIQRGPLFNEHN